MMKTVDPAVAPAVERGQIAYTHFGSRAFRGLVVETKRSGLLLECVESIGPNGKLTRESGKLFVRSDEGAFPTLSALNESSTSREAVDGFRIFIDSLCGAGHTVGLPRLPDRE